MKNIIISIYPDRDGQVFVEACKKNTSIKFVTNKRNLIVLLTITRIKVFIKELRKHLSIF